MGCRGLNDGHVEPHRPRRRRDLLADEAGADQHQPRARDELRAQPPHVAEGSTMCTFRKPSHAGIVRGRLPVAISSFS